MPESHEYLPDFTAALVIGATGMTAILQNIRMIIASTLYSVPLDRGFAYDNSFLDSPAPIVTARLTSILMDAIEKYEPRVEVEAIDFAQSASTTLMLGELKPKIVFHLKEGVEI